MVIHGTYGRVRRMMDWTGNQIKEAHGGDPVMILGIQDVPEPGRIAEVVDSDKEANKKIAMLQEQELQSAKEVSLSSIMDKIAK